MKKIRKSKYFCIVLCMALLLGIVYNPTSVQASDTATETKEVIMQEIGDISQYRDGTKTAPEKEGYVFSGWRGKLEDGSYYIMSEAQADEAAKNGQTAYAKFVPAEVLSCGFQYTKGTTILSEKTTLRLVTTVDSKWYSYVGFKVTVDGVEKEITSRTVYKTISGYTYKEDGTGEIKTYTPEQTFSPKSMYFATRELSGLNSYIFASNITVTPLWITRDGTRVCGETRSVVLENKLATIDTDNLQAEKGTDFEGFATYVASEDWGTSGYYHDNDETGEVTIIYNGVNTYAKLLPKVNGGYATLTKSCSEAIISQPCTLSVKLRLGSEADGKLQLGIYAKTGETKEPVTDTETGEKTEITKETWEWVLQYHSDWKEINTTAITPGEWIEITYLLDLKESSTQAVNVDFAYTSTVAGENNYVLIDDIKVLDANNSDIDTLGYDTFESLAGFQTLDTGKNWYEDGEKRAVIYTEADHTANNLTSEDQTKCVQMYAPMGKKDTMINFAGNTEIATEGVYKLTAKVKRGPAATNLDNIGFRFWWNSEESQTMQNLIGEGTAGDIIFGGYKRLLSLDDEWMTMVAYFKVPKTVAADTVNIQFWVWTNNDTINSTDNYVFMDDIEIYKVTPN